MRLKTESANYFADVQDILETAPEGVVPDRGASLLKAYGWSRKVRDRKKAVGLLSEKGRRQLGLVRSLCEGIVDINRVRMEAAQAEIARAWAQSDSMIRRGGTAASVGVALTGLLLGISILAPLRELESGIQRIMGGALNFEIPPKGADEIRRITKAFNAMTNRLRENQEQLVKESSTDALTGLANFRHFQEALNREAERARRYGRPLSLLLIDVDHFKAYNDVHGHEQGNEALRNVGQILRAGLRPSDILARYGGEEFVALMPETDKPQALAAAERLRRAVSEKPPRPANRRLTISLGGAAFPENAVSAKELVEKADQALYLAKNRGRDRVEWCQTLTF
jgi:diguanylate cyclase (GGDEF)-like protein